MQQLAFHLLSGIIFLWYNLIKRQLDLVSSNKIFLLNKESYCPFVLIEASIASVVEGIEHQLRN